MAGDCAIPDTVAGGVPRRLFAFSSGFLLQKRLRRILQLRGHQICVGRPGRSDGIVVWGQSRTARRGAVIADRRQLPLVRVEDAFLRSLRPGRMGDAPLGLLIDPVGVQFNPHRPSLLENMLNFADLTDANLLARADAGLARLKHLDLSKYNIHDPSLPLPAAGYVLVVDQTVGDASLRASGADHATFQTMLARAKADYPAARIIIKSHPETALGLRPGHFCPADAQNGVALLTAPVSPHGLLAGAIAVYTVASQLGFEAILAGHKPHVFGTPFYAGWQLSQDVIAIPRRTKILTPSQLFAAAMILAPTYYDPCRDRLCQFEDVLDQLEAETRAYREDRRGHVAFGMRSWKRSHLQQFFGQPIALRFAKTPQKAMHLAQTTRATVLIWAGSAAQVKPATAPILRVEDGLLRSRGLGADLIPPLSLVTDDLGIYYDPTRPSRLEALIAGPLPPGGAARVQRLVETLIKDGVTKYNVGDQNVPVLPFGHRILIPGQVEDDASIRLGAANIRTNLALLQAVRTANPNAILLYKPHPDVEAGLRPGAIPDATLKTLADSVITHTDPAHIIPLCDEVWTITSTLGFEALLRRKPVTCLGMPFYAGWGLTTDLCPAPDRRKSIADQSPAMLLRLAHAALISYPRYFDPVTRRPCPPELAVDRLINGPIPRLALGHRSLAKLQGHFAGFAHLWR